MSYKVPPVIAIREQITAAICAVIHTQPTPTPDRRQCSIAAEAADAVLDALAQSPQPPTDPQKILDLVTRHYKVTAQEILSASRVKHIAHARHVAMYLCRHMLGMSLLGIGRAFNRDHTTVMHALSKIENGPSTDVRDLMHRVAQINVEAVTR